MDRQYRVGGTVAVAVWVALATFATLGAQSQGHWRPLKLVTEVPGELERSIVDDPAAIELRAIARSWTERAIAPTVDPVALIDAYASGDDAAVNQLLGVSRDDVAETARRLVHLRAELSIRYPRIAFAALTGQRLHPADVVARLQQGLRRVRDRAAELRRGRPRAVLPVQRDDGAADQGGTGVESHGPWVPDPALGDLWRELEAKSATCTETSPGSAQAGSGGGGGGGGSWGDEPPEGCDAPEYIVGLLACAVAGPYAFWPCAYVAYCSFCEGEARDAWCDGDVTADDRPFMPVAKRQALPVKAR